jgi:hypothetical protein
MTPEEEKKLLGALATISDFVADLANDPNRQNRDAILGAAIAVREVRDAVATAPSAIAAEVDKAVRR